MEDIHRMILRLLIILLIAILMSGLALADSITLDSLDIEDCSVLDSYGANQDSIYSSCAVNYSTEFSGSSAFSLFHFDLSGIPTNIEVDSVCVFVHTTEASATMYIARMITLWDTLPSAFCEEPADGSGEHGPTWNYAKDDYDAANWNWSSGDVSTADYDDNSGSWYATATSDGSYNVYFTGGSSSDLATLFENWITGTWPSYGFTIVSDDAASEQIHSTENVQASWRPWIYIEYTETGEAPTVNKRRKLLLVN